MWYSTVLNQERLTALDDAKKKYVCVRTRMCSSVFNISLVDSGVMGTVANPCPVNQAQQCER